MSTWYMVHTYNYMVRVRIRVTQVDCKTQNVRGTRMWEMRQLNDGIDHSAGYYKQTSQKMFVMGKP